MVEISEILFDHALAAQVSDAFDEEMSKRGNLRQAATETRKRFTDELNDPETEPLVVFALAIAALSQLEGCGAGGEGEEDQEGERADHVGSAWSPAPAALAGGDDRSTEYT